MYFGCVLAYLLSTRLFGRSVLFLCKFCRVQTCFNFLFLVVQTKKKIVTRDFLYLLSFKPLKKPFSLYVVCCYSHPFTDPSLFHLHHLWRWSAPSRRVIVLILEDRSLGDIQRWVRSVLVASVDIHLILFFDFGTQQPWRPGWLLVQYRAHQHHRQWTGRLQL